MAEATSTSQVQDQEQDQEQDQDEEQDQDTDIMRLLDWAHALEHAVFDLFKQNNTHHSLYLQADGMAASRLCCVSKRLRPSQICYAFVHVPHGRPPAVYLLEVREAVNAMIYLVPRLHLMNDNDHTFALVSENFVDDARQRPVMTFGSNPPLGLAADIALKIRSIVTWPEIKLASKT